MDITHPHIDVVDTALNNAGRFLASIGSNGTIQVWSFSQRKPIFMETVDASLTCVSWMRSESGDIELVCGTESGHIIHISRFDDKPVSLILRHCHPGF